MLSICILIPVWPWKFRRSGFCTNHLLGDRYSGVPRVCVGIGGILHQSSIAVYWNWNSCGPALHQRTWFHNPVLPSPRHPSSHIWPVNLRLACFVDRPSEGSWAWLDQNGSRRCNSLDESSSRSRIGCRKLTCYNYIRPINAVFNFRFKKNSLIG